MIMVLIILDNLIANSRVGYGYARSGVPYRLQRNSAITGIGVIGVTTITTLVGRSGPMVVGKQACLLLCPWREPRGVALYLGDGGDKNHKLLGELRAAHRSPTTRIFPDRASGLIGRGALEGLKAWCEVRMEGLQVLQMWPKCGEASLPCSEGSDLSMGRTLEKLGLPRFS